jgi:hypothetical protein
MSMMFWGPAYCFDKSKFHDGYGPWIRDNFVNYIGFTGFLTAVFFFMKRQKSKLIDQINLSQEQ